MGMAEPTPLYRLIEAKLDGTLAQFIADRRPHTPWRLIAIELSQLTGVDVTYETVRVWGQTDTPASVAS